MAFLELNGIQKRFGDVAAVQDFNLAAERGEFVSFLGPSGCGKTTTLRMIAGFETPDRGQHRDRRKGRHPPGPEPAQRRHGLPVLRAVPEHERGEQHRVRTQDPKAAEGRHRSARRRVARASSTSKVAATASRGSYRADSSSAWRWRAPWPSSRTVLLLDEPLSALDAKIRVALRHEIRQIQRQLGITTVYVTHDQEEALELSDRIVVMSEGRIEQIGTPFEIYNFPATAFVASFVGTLNAMDATIVDASAGRLSLAGHEIRTTSELTGSAGATVTIALRPEMIALTSPDGSNVVAVSPMDGMSGTNRLPGTVADIAFLGSVVRVRTTVGPDAIPVFVDTFNNPNLAVPAAGSPIVLGFPPEACLVLGRDVVPDRTDALAAAEAML